MDACFNGGTTVWRENQQEKKTKQEQLKKTSSFQV